MYGDPPETAPQITPAGQARVVPLLEDADVLSAFQAKDWRRFDALVTAKSDLDPIGARLLIFLEVGRRARAS
jgi:hypothetical protein